MHQNQLCIVLNNNPLDIEETFDIAGFNIEETFDIGCGKIPVGVPRRSRLDIS
jgi:hypothetical protein